MTASYTKEKLSGSTNGKQIAISGSATPGTLVHTAISGSGSWDEVWIWAVNSQTASTKLTIEWGENTVPDGNIEVIVSGESGLFLVVPGLIIQNSLEIRAFSNVVNVLMLSGYVNRITP